MNVEFKYALGDNVKFKQSTQDGEGYIVGHKIMTGKIFHAEISTDSEGFGLKPRKPSICYKVQLTNKSLNWEYVHESSIVELC